MKAEDFEPKERWVFMDRRVNRFLNGVPLPEELHEPKYNLRFRDAIHDDFELSGYFEAHRIATATGLSFEDVRTVLNTLMAMGRLRQAYQICSKRTGRCLIFGLLKKPEFIDGVFKIKDSFGSWHRYREEKVYIVLDWYIPKKWRVQ